MKTHVYRSPLIISFFLLIMTLGFVFKSNARAEKQPTSEALNLYLPAIYGGLNGSATQTPGTPTGDDSPETPTPVVTPTPTTQPTVTLPTELVGTWFTGNAPLNDFYDPNSGEWRDVNGIGQMYLFAPSGDYTYTAFARFQTGACKSEVSVFKQGIAQTEGVTLTLQAQQSKTRTVIFCPSRSESITEGSQAPMTVNWAVGPNDSGLIQLVTTEAGAEGSVQTQFYKLGMAESLVGMWHTDELLPAGFYDEATKTFALDSPKGMWFEFADDATYRFGEHNTVVVDQQGCTVEFWVYQTGTINVVGGQMTVTPTVGIRRYVNSCGGEPVIEDPWLDEVRTYIWFHRNLTDEIKLVLMPQAVLVDFVFKR